MTHALNTDRTAAVATDTYWLPITPETPIGVKMLLINQGAGVAVISSYTHNDRHWTHWAPLPRFRPLTWDFYDSEDDQK